MDDPLWPRASAWLADGTAPARVAVLGVPAHRTSISPTRADLTPAAIRAALARYSTFSATHGINLAQVPVVDLGDVADPDGPAGEARVADAVARADVELLIALGGDNSITYSVASARMNLGEAGLITFDAHHDLRDGISNGSPVRRLVDAGLDPRRIVQIGIADFSNSPAYAQRARELGITVITRSTVADIGIAAATERALGIAGAHGSAVYVDIDVDVCDRAAVPACPAAAPGGITAAELRQAAFLCGADPRVTAIDITEIDAAADAADGRTVRLGALCLLEAAAGFARR